MTQRTQTRVLLADDHEMIRAGLKQLLKDEGVDVIGEAGDGRRAVQLAAELLPDVIVMDIHMPELNGIEATRQIKAGNGHGPRVIALTADGDERNTREMLRAGASAYVLKRGAFKELAEAVKQVASNKVYLSPDVASVIIDDYARRGPNGQNETPSAFTQLSPREREVLQLLAEGKATKQMAAHLHVSVKTVETHRRNIMEKLNTYSVAELTKYAIREGLTTVEN